MRVKPSSRGCCWWFLVVVTLALVYDAIVYTVQKKTEKSEGAAPITGPPGAIEKKYADALKIAMQFFDIQRCMFSFHYFSFSHYSILEAFFFLNT
jgi:hypothetical protein